MSPLPSGTTARFALLIAAAVGVTVFAYDFLYVNLAAAGPPCPTAEPCLAPYGKQAVLWMTAGPILLIALAYAIHLATPAWIIYRGSLQPLDGDAAAAMLDRLVREAGLARPPTFLASNRDVVSGGAFGRRNRAFVRLDAGLLTRLRENEPIVRHELAHLANRDVGKHSFTNAIWWAFVLVALLPLMIVVAVVATRDLLSVGVRAAVLAVIVLLIRNAVLRVREHEADATARSAPPDTTSRRRGTHPSHARRVAVVADPGLLAVPSVAEAAATGLICVLPVNDVVTLLVQTGWADPLAVRWAASAPFAAVGGAVLGITVWRAVLARRAGFWRLAAVAAGFAVGVLAAYPLSLPAALTGPFGALGTPGPAELAVLVGLPLVGAGALVAWAATTARTWRDSGRRIGVAVRCGAVLCAYATTVLIGSWLLLHDLHPVLSILADRARGDYREVAAGGLPVGPYAIWLVSGHSLALQLIWTSVLPPLFVAAWLFPLLAGARLRSAVVTGVGGGVCFAAALVLWRLDLHASRPASVRGGPQFALAFAYLGTMLAVAAQALVAVVVAARTRRVATAVLAALITGLLAVAAQLTAIPAGGCLPAMSLRPGPCAWDLDLTFVELVLRWTVLEGGLAAVLLALLGVGLARLVHRGTSASPLNTREYT